MGEWINIIGRAKSIITAQFRAAGRSAPDLNDGCKLAGAIDDAILPPLNNGISAIFVLTNINEDHLHTLERLAKYQIAEPTNNSIGSDSCLSPEDVLAAVDAEDGGRSLAALQKKAADQLTLRRAQTAILDTPTDEGQPILVAV